jgi:hypothetical protein
VADVRRQLMECGGYVARIASHSKPFSIGGFISQYFLIVVVSRLVVSDRLYDVLTSCRHPYSFLRPSTYPCRLQSEASPLSVCCSCAREQSSSVRSILRATASMLTPISLCYFGRVHNDHPSSWSLPHRIIRGRHSSRHEDHTYTSPGRGHSECWSCPAGASVMQSPLSTIFLTALLDVQLSYLLHLPVGSPSPSHAPELLR